MTNPFQKYVTAEIKHAVNGAVTKEDAKNRLEICMACEFRAIEYTGVTDPKGVGFCAGGCGCGATGRAQLEIKVTIAGATCPKDKWKTNPQTEGGSYASAKQAIMGFSKSASEVIGAETMAYIAKFKAQKQEEQNSLNKL